jgi:MerR family transcriptional regulator, light-induced transcriptional regulator
MDGVRHAVGSAKHWQQTDTAYGEIRSDGVDSASVVQQRAKLARIIEGEIIPRLMMTHRELPVPDADASRRAPPPVDVPGFARLVVKEDLPVASAYVSVLRAGGRSVESVLLDLLAPCARHLGELWEADLCDFVDVTLGLAHLQQLLRDISPPEPEAPEFSDDSRRVLLAPAPGESHTFGISMVEQFFRMAGWDVWAGSSRLSLDIQEIVRTEFFGIVGFSLSCETRIGGLASGIRKIRRESCNPSIAIMVGGPLFLQRPELMAQVGADATASDGAMAVLRAQSLLAMRARGC